MKKFLLTLLVLFSLALVNELLAATYMDGYVIKDGDSIFCKIKTWSTISGLKQTSIQKEIITQDSTGKETKYLPTQIQRFGFMYGPERMTFVPRVLKEGEEPIFMREVILGQRLNLYSYDIFTTSYVYTPSGGHTTSGYATNYVIEDENKRTVIYENGSWSNGKRIKEFFKDQPDLLKLYKQKVPNFYQFPDFIYAANHMK